MLARLPSTLGPYDTMFSMCFRILGADIRVRVFICYRLFFQFMQYLHNVCFAFLYHHKRFIRILKSLRLIGENTIIT